MTASKARNTTNPNPGYPISDTMTSVFLEHGAHVHPFYFDFATPSPQMQIAVHKSRIDRAPEIPVDVLKEPYLRWCIVGVTAPSMSLT